MAMTVRQLTCFATKLSNLGKPTVVPLAETRHRRAIMSTDYDLVGVSETISKLWQCRRPSNERFGKFRAVDNAGHVSFHES